MNDIATAIHPREVASVISWWREMGVDTVVDDFASPWLGRTSAPAQAKNRAVKPSDAPRAASSLPATLSAFTEWLMTSPDVPGAGPATRRIAPSGDAASGVMVLIDMPEAGDADHLLSGEAGMLFDRMLAAIGRDRNSIYLASVAVDRPPSGMIDDAALPRLSEIARHHVALAAPKQLWLLGGAPSRALIAMSEIEGAGRLHEINHAAGTTSVIASLHPRNLLQSPRRKAAVWADMQNLFEEVPA
ncbi:MAG: uracil-DNA glycosylase family protein [Sphingomonadaceae bacterium]